MAMALSGGAGLTFTELLAAKTTDISAADGGYTVTIGGEAPRIPGEAPRQGEQLGVRSVDVADRRSARRIDMRQILRRE